jgi:hypothetical protein
MGFVTTSRAEGEARAPYRAGEFRASVGLRNLGLFFGYGVSLSALYATTGIGVPCLFRTVTGWQCPFCGGTRLGSALLHGDVVGAFGDNPLVLIGLTVLGILGLLWTIEVLGGPKLRPPRAITERLVRVHPTRWLVLGLVVAVVYTLLRNLL